jgi:hypothetical protein
MLRLLFHLLRAAARAAVARQRRGPLRPSWSFGYEAILGMLRSYMAWLTGLDIPTQRIAASLASRSPEQRQVSTERISAGGVRATWFTPPDAEPARVVVYLHGGGFTFGSAQQDAGFIARIAVGARQRVLGDGAAAVAVPDAVSGLAETGCDVLALVQRVPGDRHLCLAASQNARAAGPRRPARIDEKNVGQTSCSPRPLRRSVRTQLALAKPPASTPRPLP